MNITKNFTLEELLHSDTAIQRGFLEQTQPPKGVIENAIKLTENILQPLRDAYGKSITVNCCYRCPRLNLAVGGVVSSQHLDAKAADITAGSQAENKKLFDLIQSLNLPFDQLIDEKNYSWIHVSFDQARNRKQILHL